ncbi:MAG: S41 family peptidase [Nibricoccus sp.]
MLLKMNARRMPGSHAGHLEHPRQRHSTAGDGRLHSHGWVIAGLLLVLFFGGCATAPTVYREPPKLAVEDRVEANLKVFDKAWSLVDRNYFDPKFRGVDWRAQRERYRPEAAAAADDDALYRVINRMAAELKESHLAALSPRRTHEFSSGFRVAAGFTWQVVEGRLVVTRVVPGSPAELAGIKPGWVVVSRNGIEFSAEPRRDSFVARMGEAIRFVFLDEHEQRRELELQPQPLKFEQRVARVLPDGTLYLRFDEFTTLESTSWLSEQLKMHRAAPAAVIDLRQNPGGKMFGLRMAVAEFFEHRVLIGHMVKRSGRDGLRSSLSLLSAKFPGRVVLLVGPNTGSAAEIFAHVLQHEHRATVVGRKTAGAVVSSLFYSLPGGGKMQVPFCDYVGVDGRRLEGRGVTPDVEVRATLADLRAGIDAELEAALAESKKIAVARGR